MAHWPKTISGNVFTIALAILVVPMLVWFLITLPALFQLGLAAVALAFVALSVWRHRLEKARERNWVGEFSFGDVVRRRRAHEALEVAAR
jgi:ABC-type polysaccharide transport system permease subunit